MAHALVIWVTIASGNGMSRQAIGWTNANVFVNRVIIINFGEIKKKMLSFPFGKMYLNVVCKYRPFCLSASMW